MFAMDSAGITQFFPSHRGDRTAIELFLTGVRGGKTFYRGDLMTQTPEQPDLTTAGKSGRSIRTLPVPVRWDARFWK